MSFRSYKWFIKICVIKNIVFLGFERLVWYKFIYFKQYINRMVIKSEENSAGARAFLVGVILAVLIGLSTTILSMPTIVAYSAQVYAILVILGLVIGFIINIPSKEDSQTFLMAGAVLVIVSKFGMDSVRGSLIGVGVGDAVSSVFGALLALFVPATIVVALKKLFSIAKV